MDSDVDAGEVEHGGQDGLQCHMRIGNAHVLRHQEGGGAHDGGHDLAARGGAGLRGAGKVVAVTHPLHHGDGERAGGGHICRRTAGNHAEQAAGHRGHFSRAAGGVARNQTGQVNESVASASGEENGAENNKGGDDGGGNAGHTAQNAPVAVADDFHDALQLEAGMAEGAGDIFAEQGIGQANQTEDGDGDADGTPGCLHDAEHKQNTQHKQRGGHLEGGHQNTFARADIVEHCDRQDCDHGNINDLVEFGRLFAVQIQQGPDDNAAADVYAALYSTDKGTLKRGIEEKTGVDHTQYEDHFFKQTFLLGSCGLSCEIGFVGHRQTPFLKAPDTPGEGYPECG